jgi:hypothetical protein
MITEQVVLVVSIVFLDRLAKIFFIVIEPTRGSLEMVLYVIVMVWSMPSSYFGLAGSG